ncbi:MAG TPA: hypothetical protein VMB66_01005 [Candidatus Acidoferrales bacterium]|nr:hypothetical protein [Candidatus Acidoferrales bacterium]
MRSIRNIAYAALLAAATFTIAPVSASAQAAHGKFTLTHDVFWGSAKIPAGAYAFSYDPNNVTPVLTLSKISGAPGGFLVLVPSSDPTKTSDSSLLVLESTPAGSYVSAMQLPESGITLRFAVPEHATEKQVAKAGLLASRSGQ